MTKRDPAPQPSSRVLVRTQHADGTYYTHIVNRVIVVTSDIAGELPVLPGETLYVNLNNISGILVEPRGMPGEVAP